MSIDNKLEELKESFQEDLKSIVEGTYQVNEADNGDGKVESKEELMAYAKKLAKQAFGDDVDESKVKGVVDNAIKDSDGDWEKAAGIVTGSFNESKEEDSDEEVLTEEPCEKCGKEPCCCEDVKESDESEEESEEKEDSEDEKDED